MRSAVYQIGAFRLDCGRFELLRNGYSIKLERKPLELLILFVESGDRLVTREDIAQRLWERDVFVDIDHGINTAIRKLRQALRDDPDDPRFIQTVTGMGYRFIAPVDLLGTNPVEVDEATAGATESEITAPKAEGKDSGGKTLSCFADCGYGDYCRRVRASLRFRIRCLVSGPSIASTTDQRILADHPRRARRLHRGHRRSEDLFQYRSLKLSGTGSERIRRRSRKGSNRAWAFMVVGCLQ